MKLRLCGWILTLTYLGQAQAQDISFENYHSQQEIEAYLLAVADSNPDLATFEELGLSLQGRAIQVLTLSSQPLGSVPAVFFNGTHHGNEKSSTEGILGLIDFIVRNQTQPEVAKLLSNYAIYFMPLVNPDGHAASSRYDSRGRDPNRDYAYPDRSSEQSFRIREIQLVRELTDRIGFHAAAAYHSGMEAVLFPWCHSPMRLDEYEEFYSIAKSSATAMNMSNFRQSYFDYKTYGEFIDYAYMEHGTLAMTFEVSRAATPREQDLAAVVQRSILGARAFMNSLFQRDSRFEKFFAGPIQELDWVDLNG